MRRALVLLAAAAGAVLAGGVLIAVTWHLSFGHGMFCALGLASTDGCDVAPQDGGARLAAALLMLTAIPLLAAAYGSLHLDQVRKHVDNRLSEHHQAIHDRLDRLERHNSERGAR